MEYNPVMTKSELCMFESIAQDRASTLGIKHPVQCPIKDDCHVRGRTFCLQILEGKPGMDVVEDLVKSASDQDAIVNGLFTKGSSV